MATLHIKNFPDALHDRLQSQAERGGRSLSQEVIHLLGRAVEESEATSVLDLKGLGRELWREIDVARYLDDERGSWDR